MYIKFATRLKVIVAVVVHFSRKLRPMKCQWERNVISSNLNIAILNLNIAILNFSI